MTFVFPVQRAMQSKTNEFSIRLFVHARMKGNTFTDTKNGALGQSGRRLALKATSAETRDRERGRKGQSGDGLDRDLTTKKYNAKNREKMKKKKEVVFHQSVRRRRRQGREEREKRRIGKQEGTFFYWLENKIHSDI